MLEYGDCSVPYDRVSRDGNIDSLVDSPVHSPVDYGYYYNGHIYKPENDRLLRYSDSGIVTLDYVFCRITIINDELTIQYPLPEPEPEPPTEVRVRKEVHTLTVEQRELFTQTYRQAWDAPDSELKQMADEFLTNFSRGLHNNGAFLPWHRGYLLLVENQLREISPNITIPYWNWNQGRPISEDSIWGDGPGQFSGNGGANRCVTDGPFGTESGFEMTNGRCLERRISGGRAASATEVQNLLDRYPSASSFDQFRNRLEHGPGMHDSVHCIVGGTMCSARASNDPVFFLHHANIDRIWAGWQGQSEEHRSAYTGNTSRDEFMPVSPYTPVDLLDMRHLPGTDGGFVEVRYESSR